MSVLHCNALFTSRMKFVLLSFLVLINFQICLSVLPIVIWHGLGDVCCNPLSIGGLQKFIQQEIPDVYVISLKIGKTIKEDFENAYIKNANDQVKFVCDLIRNDSKLALGYQGLGISQGGQFLRAVAQRCPNPPMANLITLGSQHQGVYGLPRCLGDDVKFCNYIRTLLNHGAYKKWIQNFIAPAEYWHDPLDEETYKEASVFLADINNERAINETYKTNLQQLKNFVMVKFTKDTVVQPIETEWFGFYRENDLNSTYTLQESPLYIEDRLGLRTMDSQGKLHFLKVEGDHIQFSQIWFKQTIIEKFLR
ncbi:palmitoyl-protein thioesterase 1 isoform X1 [Daphnia magna]|uniref:Palmitoyl-protein thioesterase 1 n=1 Tax=Daphnia magna TaxID=35525 RepID=A0A0P5U6A2_9CRUS|nr:palmitoyl-protein thioesterase 1 isoform X1 [Daphnia magna]KZS18637.1 Lysosomal thioesterase PPT2 [Daphnia magna]